MSLNFIKVLVKESIDMMLIKIESFLYKIIVSNNNTLTQTLFLHFIKLIDSFNLAWYIRISLYILVRKLE